MTLLGLVLDVRDRDRDAALALLGSLVDHVEWGERVHVRVRVMQHLGDRRGKSRLTVVDVTDGADVDVRLGPLELGLRHWVPPQDCGPAWRRGPLLVWSVFLSCPEVGSLTL